MVDYPTRIIHCFWSTWNPWTTEEKHGGHWLMTYLGGAANICHVNTPNTIMEPPMPSWQPHGLWVFVTPEPYHQPWSYNFSVNTTHCQSSRIYVVTSWAQVKLSRTKMEIFWCLLLQYPKEADLLMLRLVPPAWNVDDIWSSVASFPTENFSQTPLVIIIKDPSVHAWLSSVVKWHHNL